MGADAWPSRAEPEGEPDAGGESVGVATGLDGAGPVDAAGEAPADTDDDAEGVASSYIAPGEPVVDEHPATAAVTSTSPTLSSFMRGLIASLDPWSQGCESPRLLFDEP